MSSSMKRENDGPDLQGDSKRPKIEEEKSLEAASDNALTTEKVDKTETEKASENILPPSHALLGIPHPVAENGRGINFRETDVGISEYVGKGVSKIEGIIKQRFTDFLVFEVDLDGNVIHLKSLVKPDPPKKNPAEEEAEQKATTGVDQDTAELTVGGGEEKKPDEDEAPSKSEPEQPPGADEKSNEPWPESFNSNLAPYLSTEAIAQLKEMYLQGPEPPRVSDSGWAGRVKPSSEDASATEIAPQEPDVDRAPQERGRGRGGKRGGGRGGGRGGRRGQDREDHRKVLSEPIESKATRTTLHKLVRELFGGKLESETDPSAPASEDGSRIVIKWSKRGVGRGGRDPRNTGRGERAPRGTFPPYIHFTMQKTNRDTQDALGHLSRMLKANVKDLSVAGTKDKRGVTVQRVSLKRGNKTVEDVWRLANGIGRRSAEQAVSQRGERGVRIADLNYRKASLELGMLKGNAFVITLRNVQVDSMDTLDKALDIIKNHGFINYYGMQRFGTASVPTHAIGLALLQSEWHKAVSLILQTRYGEHPEVEAARKAWLVDRDIDKALSLMPRRVVAERCILESYKKQKGDTRNAMGALSTIPRNLRLMYVHAYQSYVWNAIVSERIRMHGADKPVVGDLVFDEDPGENVEVDNNSEGEDDEKDQPEPLSNRARKKQSRKPWTPPRVKVLTEDDLDKYSIFDIIMPLPGTDVAYPGGALGARYRQFLEMDGLDPDNWVRKQRDYTLAGSYRKILHLPSELTWSVLRYTDPDVPLAQADEDKLLGFDSPVVVEDGKFLALQINLTLGTASYATMALREITKTETSSHFQTSLTIASEDQKYKGTGDVDEDAEPMEDVEEA
ncbi:tRNA pseudouridine synthase D [Dendrothele bispora CBS 962.96]|uniref:tRNA pseudouridine synthase D n=1 Tax=Dendrothele bispora (strain CBS 962.96) TaxID=1314807 RepID=A0A4S8MZ61_DENBC|nr:tRNA pseudouridine synthase D [Dendrothele bispora CBS 962.96]